MFRRSKAKVEQVERPGDFGGTNFEDVIGGFWLSDVACSVRDLSVLALTSTVQTADSEVIPEE